MKVTNILTTGGYGYLGKVLSANLQQKGFQVNDIQDFFEARQDISISFNIPSDLKFETIIHIAGKAHNIPYTKEEEKVFYDVNLEGTKNICAAIDRLVQKPKSFIFISTVSVYGLDHGEHVSEDYPLLGYVPYAKSKILAEKFLNAWAKKNNITLSILRLPLVAGPNPPGNLGAMIQGIKSGRYLSIGKAISRKSIVWVGDIAAIIPRLIEVGGTYNLTDGYHPSFGELELVISKALGKRTPITIPLWIARCLGYAGDIIGRYFPINSGKINKIVSTLTFDDEKARQELGWTPSNVLDKLSEHI